MRILNRPMFRYGGPIKEGVMHGMKNGGRAALVGNPVYPKTDGREHHFAVSGTVATVAALNAARIAAMRYGARYLPRIWQGAKRMFGTTTPAKFTRGTHQVGTATGSYSPVVSQAAKFNPNYFGRDPLVQGLNWGRKAIFNPTTGGWGKSALRFATSPSSLLIGGLYYANGKWFNKKGVEVPPPKGMEDGPPGGGDPGMFATPKKPEGPNPAQLAAAAKAARNAKLEKYLDTMGYDKAKKGALGDALIDASAIVQGATDEAGSLKKADWSKMINQAIQTTSKRLDKPEQIREAVGLMMTKADIEKDMEDPQTKELRRLQILGAEKALAGKTTAELIQERMLKGDYPSGKNLARLVTLNNPGANIKVIPSTGMDVEADTIDYITAVVKKSHDEGKPFPPGNYVIKDRIIQVDETGTVTPIPISALK